ncbi:amino acid/amide ABC transporter ATP-binding protein 1 (HAAT family) [Sphaerotilus hippei]|uniref:Amino acid/amide ABC transporter ATP-binding protein 1 (HAAT family) n=1 Tax=Sphaerotilus hippei TaxID=744406 RepID=A0A318H3J7_9BURK|nr:ABC transporter ATP-binding protein [Sphaerotilus hippei]PXW97994.1 amino acid/amide ABC transporter ATP-binding protein 1 (HAAT family) [Sphaerotilus hippei]
MSRPDPHGADPRWALALQGVSRRFGATEVLRGVDLRVRPGERVAVIGPNGAGKSTLFHVISGQFAPSAGEIRLQGRRIDGLAPHRIHRLGLARSFQVSQLFPSLSVFDNLRCAVLWRQGVGQVAWRFLSGMTAVTRRADELLAQIGLAHRRDLPARQLTYAEQRSLEIGLAIAGEPPVVLLDEPTAGMSRSETDRCVALIRRVTAGRTLLVVEHDMSVVFQLADRIAVLVAGELIAFDTPERVRADERVRQAYLGTPAGSPPC